MFSIQRLIADEPVASCCRCGHRMPAEDLFVLDDFRLVCASCWISHLDAGDEEVVGWVPGPR